MGLTPRDALDRDFLERWALPALDALSAYHRYRVHGLEHVPRTGPALLVLTHAMASYESLLLIAEIYRRTGRVLRGLGDRLWFEVPGLGRAFTKIGFIEAHPGRAEELLRAGEILGVTPGGMWEALRPREERFRVRWEGRTGFARVALAARIPVVLGACPAADLVYTLRRSRVTDEVYRRFKFPLPLMSGIGPTWLPKPVKLAHHLAPPILPPEVTLHPEHVLAFRDELRGMMERWIDQVVRREGLAVAEDRAKK